MVDFSYRAYSHSFHYDPVVRSLLDTDFYKFLMLQVIWEHYPHANVTFSLKNRTTSVKLGEVLNMDELAWQLDHVRTLQFTEDELIWLRGQTFYGIRGLFKEPFIEYLRNFRLPEYNLRRLDDGQLDMHFPTGIDGVPGMLWEMYSLTVTNELRNRAVLGTMKKSELDITYARAKVKLYDKLEALQSVPDLNLTDFGTRRRHSFLWQEHAVLTAREVLGARFTGTSNAFLAKKHGLDAKGTNAHEMPMMLAAMTVREWDGSPDLEDRLRDAQYEVLRTWAKTYDGGLRIFLPDTFGTTQFLKNAPRFVDDWLGARPDSKEPIAAGEELIDWWKSRGQNPLEKLVIFSAGLDVATPNRAANGPDIVHLADHFRGRVRVGFGWGTNLTNDFIGCPPGDPNKLKSISLVCKVSAANGRPAVKLSDNYEKASGPKEEVELYRRVFGSAGMANAPVNV